MSDQTNETSENQIDQNRIVCRTCGSNSLYRTEVSSGGGDAPNYLPQLGSFWGSAKFTLVVCENCGETTFFVPADARAKLKSSSKWRKM